MARTVEIILGYVDKTAGATAAGTSLIDQYNSDKQGFALVNQSAQTGAAVANVTSIVKLTAGFTPFLNLQINTFAATTVLLKITAEYREDRGFDTGDVISLVGNLVGVVGSLILLGGAVGAGGFVAVGVLTSLAGVVTSDVAKKIYSSYVKPIWERSFRSRPNASYQNYWVAPDLKLVTLAQIRAAYTNRIAVIQWDPKQGVVTITGKDYHLHENSAGSGGGYIENGFSRPLIFPVSQSLGWRVDIGPIEIVSPQNNFIGIDRYH